MGHALCWAILGNLADEEDVAPALVAAGAIQLAKDAHADADASKPLPYPGRPGNTVTVAEYSSYLLMNLCQHEVLHADLLRADLPSAILAMTTDPDKDTAFSALLSLAFMLGGDDDKNNPHIVAASAAVPLLCEQLRHGGQIFKTESISVRYSMLGLLAPAAKIVINDDNKQQMYNVEMLPVLEMVLAQQMPGEEEAEEEGAAHKIVVILLHLSFINAGLDWLVVRKSACGCTLHTNLDTLANTDGVGQAGRDAGLLCFRISRHSYSSGVSSGVSSSVSSPASHHLARHVMVSYCWAQKPIVIQFCQVLREMGYEVWRDEEGPKYVGPISGNTM